MKASCSDLPSSLGEGGQPRQAVSEEVMGDGAEALRQRATRALAAVRESWYTLNAQLFSARTRVTGQSLDALAGGGTSVRGVSSPARQDGGRIRDSFRGVGGAEVLEEELGGAGFYEEGIDLDDLFQVGRGSV